MAAKLYVVLAHSSTGLDAIVQHLRTRSAIQAFVRHPSKRVRHRAAQLGNTLLGSLYVPNHRAVGVRGCGACSHTHMPPTCSLPFVLLRASGVAAKLLKSAIAEVRYGGLCTDTSAAAVKLRQRLGVSLGKLGSTSC